MIELIDKVLSKEINEAVAVFPSEIDRLGRILFNINCHNCDNKRTEVYLKLYKNKKTLTKQLKDIMERKFQLKENFVTVIPQLGLTVSNRNLTDEIAYKMLAHNPAFINQFEVFPEDWESGPNKKPKKEVKAEVKEPAKDVEKKPAEKKTTGRPKTKN